jgi:hypothetical protein
MPSRCYFAMGALAGVILEGLLWASALGQSASAPTMTSSPPQQMPVNGVPAAYPSTSYPYSYPATSYPSYPSTSDSEYVPMPPAGSRSVGLGAGDADHVYRPYGSPDAMAAARVVAQENQLGASDGHFAVPGRSIEQLMNGNDAWTWQLMPAGLLFRSYLAGLREPRIGSEIVHERQHGWYWDATVGGRVGIIRYGTDNDIWPQGWQFDIEGAAFPRLDLEHNEDLVSADFRGGFLSTTRQGPFETKFGFYHLSSHLGDEYMIRYPSTFFTRINYVRESLVAGIAYYLNPSLRLYAEAGWTFQEDGGAQPWEFQFGADFSSPQPTGISGAPFFAINAHLRQENNFGGNLSVQTGWQWRGRTGHLLRTGLQYFTGMSDQYQFYNQFEEQIGFGLWYDY